MTDGVKPAELSAKLADEIESVIDALGLKKQKGGGGVIRCVAPWGDPKKFKLEVKTNRKRGSWNDWGAGRSGDALGLVGCVLTAQPDMRTKEARSEGVKWAKARYGIAGGDFDRAAWQRNVEAAKVRQRDREKAEAAELKRQRGIAQAIWINALPLRPSSRARPGCDGARYLEARGIDFAQLGRLPRAIRFSPEETWKDPDKILPDHVGPALVTAMTLPDGSFAAIHRTWIDPSQPGEKAPVPKPRKVWPSSDGAAMRLWRGSHGHDEREAEANGERGPLVVCEGVETGLSIAMLTPEYRVHAAGSLPGILSYQPPKCASEIIVAGENDWGAQAQAMLSRAVIRLRSMALPVKVARSPVGNDFNDLLRGVE